MGKTYKYFTANYINADSNFVICNISDTRIDGIEHSLYCVLKNLLLRGCPTRSSEYLNQFFEPVETDHKIRLLPDQAPDWSGVIKGGKDDNPALQFYYETIPHFFPDYPFLNQLMIPECPISSIIYDPEDIFAEQTVDFYLPEAKLVIEIDGTQHHRPHQSEQDKKRNAALNKEKILVIRIPAESVRTGDKALEAAMGSIRARISNGDYRVRLDEIADNTHLQNREIILKQIAVIRLQIAIVQLLLNGTLTISDSTWKIAIHNHEVTDYEKHAIEDLLIWIDKLFALAGRELSLPAVTIENTDDLESISSDYIKIDQSVLKVATPSYAIDESVIYIAADADQFSDFFTVETGEPIDYPLKDLKPEPIDGKSYSDSREHQALLYFLKNIFGHSTFNLGQEGIIINALQRKDTIGVLPTGSGKSLCYQMCMLLQPCVHICVSPIKALMIDQVQNLKDIGITRVTYISSDLKPEERKQEQDAFSRCEYLLAIISPERFQSEDYRDFLQHMSSSPSFHFGYAVIDEVHCLSEWGHSFRVSYLNLVKSIRKYCGETTLLGLTATASLNVLKNIQIEFGMDVDNTENVITVPYYTRKNLTFAVVKPEKTDKYDGLISVIDAQLEKNPELFKVNGKSTNCGLIFTPHVNGDYGCKNIAELLSVHYKSAMADIRFYSGQRPKKSEFRNDREFDDYKRKTQSSYKNNEFPLLVATKAFGIGIDKPNITYTIHYGIPSSREALYQEAGRAGRDEKIKNALCTVVFSPETEHTKQMMEKVFDPFTSVEEIKMITNSIGFDGEDGQRQLFLLAKGLVTRKDELECASFVLARIRKAEDSNVLITANDDRSFDILQKVLYHMSVVGIIGDWTVNWIIKGVRIYPNSYDKETLIYTSKEYISKYSNDEQLEKFDNRVEEYGSCEFYEIPVINAFYSWYENNIIYSRRMALKNIYDDCEKFKEGKSFKEQLEKYFRLDEVATLFGQIADDGMDYGKWFEVLDARKIKSRKADDIAVTLSRFLETYQYNVGLNYISGILDIIRNENYAEDARLKHALESIKKLKCADRKTIAVNTFRVVGKIGSEEAKERISEVLIRTIDIEGLEYDAYKLMNDNYSLSVIVRGAMTSIVRKVGA